MTDTRGATVLYRRDNSCEDVIRPFRRTITFHDLTWTSVSVSAKGYRKVDHLWLHTFKYEDKRAPGEGEHHRLEFRIPLRKSKHDPPL